MPRAQHLEIAKEDCPDRKSHTEGPSGYIEWHDFAKNLAETHVQGRCPSCLKWVIWTRKRVGHNA